MPRPPQPQRDSQDKLWLWNCYLTTRADADRNALVELYLPLVKMLAVHTAQRLPDGILLALDDLIEEGVLGLMAAIAKFDPGRGLQFTTYAGHKIIGAMLDALRRYDHAPRRLRQQADRLLEAERAAQADGRGILDETDLVEALGVSLPKTRDRTRRIRGLVVHSLDAPIGSDARCTVARLLPAPAGDGHDPFLWDWLVRALSRQKKLVLILYYRERWPMKQIGALLRVSESRVSQIHAEILEQLREQGEVDRCRGRHSAEWQSDTTHAHRRRNASGRSTNRSLVRPGRRTAGSTAIGT